MLLTLHHVAASGGSIVSQVLAAATNSVLISEINPLGSIHGCRGLKPHYDPTSLLWHLVYNSKDLSPKLKLRYFFGQLDISIEHVKGLSRNLLLRDHSHTTFNFLNKNLKYNKKKLDSLFLESINYFYTQKSETFDFPRIKPIISVRHPLDSYVASRKKGWLAAYCGEEINLDNYCNGLLNFQNYMKNEASAIILRYEDLCMNLETCLENLFLNLGIEYRIPSLEEINLIKVTGKSGRKSDGIEIRERIISDIDDSLKTQVEKSKHYKRYCELNGYEPNYKNYQLRS